MNDQQLQQWVEDISLQSFHRPFLHQARFNYRLRSTGGRYFLKSHHIEISWRHYEKFGREETEKIIKHELCHYHLHLQNRGYRHRDQDFITLLQLVGGSRYCKSVLEPEQRRLPYRYRLKCKACQQEYLRKRRVNIRKYACGKCGGKLQSFEL